MQRGVEMKLGVFGSRDVVSETSLLEVHMTAASCVVPGPAGVPVSDFSQSEAINSDAVEGA